MKKLVLASLIGLTLAPQMQSQPISNLRWTKEFALGFKDYLYGMLWLTRGNNSQRNFVKGFEDTLWWHKHMKDKVLYDIGDTGANDILETHKYLDSILTNYNSSLAVFEKAFIRNYIFGSARPCKELVKKMLIKQPQLADISIRHKLGLFNPLILAIHKNDYEMVKLLVDNGANPYKNINPYEGSSYQTNSIEESEKTLNQIKRDHAYVANMIGNPSADSKTTDAIRSAFFTTLQDEFAQTNILEYLKNQKNSDQQQ